MKSKKFLVILGSSILISGIIIGIIVLLSSQPIPPQGESVAVKQVSSQITADGKVASQNEAILQFQTPGKVAYLGFKEGDSIKKGQTIASLDTYAIQRQLTIALNNYRSTRDTFDQTQTNASTGVLQGQQKYSLDVTNRAGINGQNQVDIINDMAKRIVDQNQATLDNSVAQVELNSYALQLATLSSPIDGILTRQDVTVPNVNVTPATLFVVDDPESIIFRAQVNEQDIDYVSIGSSALIRLNTNNSSPLTGTVVAIHPGKIILPSGQGIYQVDVQSDQLKGLTTFGTAGFIQITSNTSSTTTLVPNWAVLNEQYIWVETNGTKKRKAIRVGKLHGDFREVISGLDTDDKVIINPASVVSKNYILL